MNCRTHVKREAAGFCNDCGQPVCEECYQSLGGRCVSCAKNDIKENYKYFWTTMGISMAFFVLGIVGNINSYITGGVTFNVNLIFETILLAYLASGIPFGWRALNKITSQFFLFLPVIGWVIYFVVKFMLAVMIGWAVEIPKLISMCRMLARTKELSESVKQIQEQLQ